MYRTNVDFLHRMIAENRLKDAVELLWRYHETAMTAAEWRQFDLDVAKFLQDEPDAEGKL